MATLTTILLIFTSISSNSKVFAYKASVVEYAVNLQTGPLNNTIQQNVENYLKVIKDSGENNVDIVIFPESTLNYAFSNNRNEILKYAYVIPNPVDKITLCKNNSYHMDLQNISCQAKSSKVYVVINISEKKSCTNHCFPDGYYLYNSNIVFDRKGAVISRYRKTHLFGESAFNTTTIAEEETFTTDFNTTFGHLICFDLMFSKPAHNLLFKKGIKDFIVPMMWYSELPFLTAVQYQESWAISHNVNVLAAGANSPSSGCGGSGIYSGNQGSKSSYISGTKNTKVITAILGEVDDSNNNKTTAISNEGRKMRFLRDHLDSYSWIPINIHTNETQKTNICFDGFCCNIITKVKVANSSDKIQWSYLAVAYDGIRTFSGVANGGIQTCAIIGCTDNNIINCGKLPADISTFEYTHFEELSIEGAFSNDTITFPVSLDDDILPLPVQYYKYTKRCSFAEKCFVEMKLSQPRRNLLSFGIFGRIYFRDDSTDRNYRSFKGDMKSTASNDKNTTYQIFLSSLKNELSLSTNDILGIFSTLVILGVVHFIEMSQ